MQLQWIKLWVDPCLDGTLRVTLTASERCVWYELLLLATRGGRSGFIERKEGIPYTYDEIASRLNIGLPFLEETIVKLFAQERLDNDDYGALHIINWDKYQSVPDNKRRLDARQQELYNRARARELAQRYPDEVIDALPKEVLVRLIDGDT